MIDDYPFDIVKKRWQEQGIWSNTWSSMALGLWKHEKPLHTPSASASDDDVEPRRGLRGAPQTKRRKKVQLTVGQRAQMERHRQASRPIHQFLWQLHKERDRIHGEPTDGDAANSLSLDINTTAYNNIKNIWVTRGIWDIEWGILPGMSWKHERPLQWLAGADTFANDPANRAGLDNGEAVEASDVLPLSAHAHSPASTGQLTYRSVACMWDVSRNSYFVSQNALPIANGRALSEERGYPNISETNMNGETLDPDFRWIPLGHTDAPQQDTATDHQQAATAEPTRIRYYFGNAPDTSPRQRSHSSAEAELPGPDRGKTRKSRKRQRSQEEPKTSLDPDRPLRVSKSRAKQTSTSRHAREPTGKVPVGHRKLLDVPSDAASSAQRRSKRLQKAREAEGADEASSPEPSKNTRQQNNITRGAGALTSRATAESRGVTKGTRLSTRKRKGR